MNQYHYDIPKEKFELANTGERITDTKFQDKPVGYFKDAFLRFRKNKASIVAALIILAIILYAFLVPLLNFNYDASFLDAYYAKKGPRNEFLSQFGIADGGIDRTFNERGLIAAYAIGIGTADTNGTGEMTLSDVDEKYMPILDSYEDVMASTYQNAGRTNFDTRIDTYLEVGFMYIQIEQQEYQTMLDWQKETGMQLLYPLIANNEYTPDASNANYWYKMDTNNKNTPINDDGTPVKLSAHMKLADNYLRDENGNPVYKTYVGGGTTETAQYKVRILYYNYYQYKNGFAPNYLFGTDSQGYDLALRMAGGIQLSLLVAICVSVINFIIGAIYGAVEGYYGGIVDLIMERISDILAGIPFIVVATLFQLHLADKVGKIPSLLFAFVVTGWIGTAARVRTQFYRFKKQEYVMAARTLGARDRRIIWKHIFPNSLGTIVTSSVLVIPGVIFSESMLSFLGIVSLGSAETTSLGTLLSDASSIWTKYPHLMIFPAIIISLLMICFNLFGNGLRDAFNPSLRGVEE